jgi:hypothetical protein
VCIYFLKGKMEEKHKQRMEEREHVEKELSKLLEVTLRLENELYSVSE